MSYALKEVRPLTYQVWLRPRTVKGLLNDVYQIHSKMQKFQVLLHRNVFWLLSFVTGV